MKKKISLMLCLCMMALSLTACGKDPSTVDYYGKSYSDLQDYAQGMATTLVSLTDEDVASAIDSNEQYAKQYAKQYGREATEANALINMLSGWQEAATDVGAYEGLGDFTITKASGTVTLDQIVNFEERDIDLTFVYEYNYLTEELELSDANADKVYSVGEKLEKAALNTLMGMGTVFCVLILISLIIYCFKFIPVLLGGKKKEKAEEQKAAPAVAATPLAEENLADDLELVAVISAAIAASEGTTTDSFVVRSIHRR